LRYAHFTFQGTSCREDHRTGVGAAEERLRLVQELFAMNLPVADWEQMERETIRGVLEE